jgi:hypothetical protein
MTTVTDSDRVREHSDRISRLEGERIHLATTADVERMENQLLVQLTGVIVAVASVSVAISKLIG